MRQCVVGLISSVGVMSKRCYQLNYVDVDVNDCFNLYFPGDLGCYTFFVTCVKYIYIYVNIYWRRIVVLKCNLAVNPFLFSFVISSPTTIPFLLEIASYSLNLNPMRHSLICFNKHEQRLEIEVGRER